MGFEKVILFTNQGNKRNLELYNLFNDYSQYQTHVFTSKDNIKEIKNSIVLLCGYNKLFLSLDKSNFILYFARASYLSSKEILLLPILDRIVAESHQTACWIKFQIASYKMKVPIIKAIPWCGSQKLEEIVNRKIYYPNNHKCFGISLATYGRTDNPEEAWFCAVTDTYETIKLMRAEKPVMVPNEPPLNEIIIHKYNGYLISEPSDVTDSLKDYGIHRAYVARAGRTSIQALLEPRNYIKQLLAPRVAKNTPFVLSEPPTWVIQQRLFDSGKISFFPEVHNAEIAPISDFIEILEFFRTRLFSHVYVFGFEFPDYNAIEMHKAKLISKEYSRKGLKIHFCLNEIPPTWAGILKNFSIVSVNEGLKQVQK